jgi:shikimate kinase
VRVLLTGISGTGKSTVIDALRSRGLPAVDLDGDDYSHWVEVSGEPDPAGPPVEPGRDWMWREDRVEQLLDEAGSGPLWVSGAAVNMRAFLPRFDHVVLLSAPAAVIAERLATRSTNAYGKRPQEAARVLDQIGTVEPLLRRVATLEIDTSAPLERVVEIVAALG